jgi:ribonuclease III
MSADIHLAALQKRLRYEFRDPALLREAMTHGSYLQESPTAGAHNQRLEFLGDAVLHFIITDALFRTSTTEREGVLSRRRSMLSKGAFLTQMARELGLDACLRLNKSEEDAGGRNRPSILEDAFEALVGALYLDSDLAITRQIILALYGSLEERLASAEDAENPKGRLQELIQPKHGNTALRYEVTGDSGPRHARIYQVSVYLHDQLLGSGEGTSKKIAEENAAAAALTTLRQAETKPIDEPGPAA